MRIHTYMLLYTYTGSTAAAPGSGYRPGRLRRQDSLALFMRARKRKGSTENTYMYTQHIRAYFEQVMHTF